MPFLTWLGADQVRYLAISQTALLLVAVTAVAGALSPRLGAWLASRRGIVVFFALVFFALVASRWPSLFVTSVFSHDEGEFVAEANTALHYPIPWLDFDPQTAGPLNAFLLVVPGLFGAHLDYFVCRATTILLEFGTFAALYAAAALCFDAAIARLAIVPPLVFWAVALREEFVHLGSEHLPIFLGTVMLALICWAWRRGFPLFLVFLIGFVGGMMPFGKLQSVPLDAANVVVTALLLSLSPGLRLRARFARLGMLAFGLLFFPFITIEVVTFAGGFRDFWFRYIETSLAYIDAIMPPVTFLTATDEFAPFFDWLGMVTIAGGIVIFFSKPPRAIRYIYVAALIMLPGAIETIDSPGRPDPNYLLFAVVPVTAAATAALAAITWSLGGNVRAGQRRGVVAAVFVALCLFVQGAVARGGYTWIAPVLAAYERGGHLDPVAIAISQDLRPGERLAIWGYTPEYSMYTSTALGTRDPTCLWQFIDFPNPNRDYYRESYVRDFSQSRPEGFLDSGPDSWDHNGGMQSGYESFPELAALVKSDYILKSSWFRLRFFIRRDLWTRQL